MANRLRSTCWEFNAKYTAKLHGGKFSHKKTKFQVPVSCRYSKGTVVVSENVTFGYKPAPMLGNGEILLQARNSEAVIAIGANCHFSNNVSVIANKCVTIGSDLLCGANVRISDSDGHSLDPSKRNENGEIKKIVIGNNVWIGSNVVILKGVEIGDNSVIATSSVVNKNVPPNVVVAGIPAKIIKEI